MIRHLDQQNILDAHDRFTFLVQDMASTDDETLVVQPEWEHWHVSQMYEELKSRQIRHNAKDRPRMQIGIEYPNSEAQPHTRILLRLFLSLVAICVDWEVECDAPEEQRPPMLCVRLPPFHEPDVKTLVTILTTGSDQTNILQLLNLAHLYGGQGSMCNADKK